jgi:hypothetical protein
MTSTSNIVWMVMLLIFLMYSIFLELKFKYKNRIRKDKNDKN